MPKVTESEAFKKTLDTAEKVVNDKDRVNSIIKKSLKKAASIKDNLVEFKENLLTSISMVKDWVNGSYREVPKKTMVYIVAALIYFIMPIDLIPDFFFKVGLIDDYAVLTYVFTSFIVDIEKYKEYKKKQKELESLSKEVAD